MDSVASQADRLARSITRDSNTIARGYDKQSAAVAKLARQHGQLTQASSRGHATRMREIRDETDALKQLGAARGAANAPTRRSGGRGGAGWDLAIGAAVPAVVVAAGAAAEFSKVLLALPAAIGGAAAAMGTWKLATSGFGDTLKNVRDADKFAEDLQKLSPNAQQAALSIRKLLPEFDALKTATQNRYFDGMGKQFHDLSNQFLPVTQELTTGIAGAFNDTFKGIGSELMEPGTQQSIQEFVTNTVAGFKELGTAAAPFTSALTDLMAAGSRTFPELAGGIANAADRFAKFIDTASKTGELDTWIRQGITAGKQLGEIAWDIGRAFMSLAGPTREILPHLVNLVDNIADTLERHPSLIFAAAGAFGAWKTIAGVTTLLANLNMVNATLGGMPGKAQTAARGITAALSRITLPALTLSIGYELAGPLNDWLARNSPGTLQALFPNLPVGDGPAVQSRIGPDLAPSPNLPTAEQLWPGAGFGTPRASDGDWGNPSIDRRGRNVAPLPDAGLPSWEEIPVPLPPADTGASSSGSSSGYRGYTSDEALLANVPAGSYSQTGSADLVEGLGDCSSAVEDLVNLIDGRPTAGRSMSTGNAQRWLTAHGFLPGSMPGAFNVGFNDSHMQATLPGGTPFNWGSQSAAARGGVGGSGAFDPSLTERYYRPVASTYDDDDVRPFNYERTQPVSVESFSSGAASQMQQIGAPIDSDFGINGGLPGILDNAFRALANLAMAPVLGALSGVTAAYGTAGPGTGILGAFAPRQNVFGQAMPNALGQYPQTSSTGYTSAPGGYTGYGSPSFGGLGSFANGAPAGSPASGTGLGPRPGPGIPGGDPLTTGYAATPSRGIAMGQGMPASPGIGIGGGLLGAAQSAAVSAAGAAGSLGTMGGGGAVASAGAQVITDLINRSIGFGGQAIAIGTQGILETILPVESELADPSRGWFGRILGAVAGVRPAADNLAGGLTESLNGDGGRGPLTPEQVNAQKAVDRGSDAAKGAKGDTNITIHNNGATPDANGATVARHAAAANSGPGRRY